MREGRPLDRGRSVSSLALPYGRASDTPLGRALLSNGYEQASELELARQARAEDEGAFAEIVRRYSPRVFHVAHRFFRDRGHAEEAAQETFLKAFAQLKSFEGRGSMEGWLTRIATNTCLNMLRKAKTGSDNFGFERR